MKLLLILLLAIPLASCSAPTQQEQYEYRKICEVNGEQLYITNSPNFHMICKRKDDKVFDCIQKYIEAMDEKYNNPDIVSQLQEDNYSQVVKTCNETFGSK